MTKHRAGRSEISKYDLTLVRISRSFDFLLAVTPYNTEAAWQEFQAGGCQKPPRFLYRPLSNKFSNCRRELDLLSIRPDSAPDFRDMLEEKRRELIQKVDLILTRNTKQSPQKSFRLFASPDPDLLRLAKSVLAKKQNRKGPKKLVSAVQFRRNAEKEFNYYRKLGLRLNPESQIRKDVSGFMVSKEKLLIGEKFRLRASQTEAMIQHEIGTHMLTYWNGLNQPLQLLSAGLAGYEELQEGLAVFAEYLVDGLEPDRLSVLAGRVIAVQMLKENASFLDIFRALHGQHALTSYEAFSIAARVFRGGGFSKDVIYFRGFLNLAKRIKAGHTIDLCFSGKIAFHHLDRVEKMVKSGQLLPPCFYPRYYDSKQARLNIKRLIGARSVIDLLN